MLFCMALIISPFYNQPCLHMVSRINARVDLTHVVMLSLSSRRHVALSCCLMTRVSCFLWLIGFWMVHLEFFFFFFFCTIAADVSVGKRYFHCWVWVSALLSPGTIPLSIIRL